MFFLYLKLESKSRLNIFTLGIIVVLLAHEVYMYIGLNKIENFQVNIGNMDSNIDINNKSLEPIDYNSQLNNIISNNRTYNLLINDLIEIEKFVDFMPINKSILVYNNKLNITSNIAFLFNDEGNLIKTIKISETNDKYESTGLFYNDYAMFAGGINYYNNEISNNINFYNLTNNTLSVIEIAKGRYKMSSSQDENYIILAFGINDSNNISKRIDYFSKSKNNILDNSNWESLTCPYPGKLYSKVILHKEKLYIIGGFDGTEFKNNIYIYDFNRDKWSKTNINLFKNIYSLQAELIEFKSKKRLYILGSNNTQKNFYHKKLIFSLTNKPNKYSFVDENDTVGLKSEDIDGLSINEIFGSEKMNKEDYNYSYLGNYIPKIYDSISDSLEMTYTLSMWLYIDESNKEKTKIIMGDYDLCSGNSVGNKNYTCLILHKNRILPCIKLNKKLLIKNNDEVPEVQFNRWFHYVAIFKNPNTDTDDNTSEENITENFTSCVFSETLRPLEAPLLNTETENNDNQSKFFCYINGKKTVTILNTNLVYNEKSQSLTVDGYESFNEQREYANNTKLSNLKIFNGVLDQGTIYDLMKHEHNFYSKSEPELVYMDLDNKIINILDYNLTGKNCVMQSFNKQKLKIISTNMEFNYDIKKGSNYNKNNLDTSENIFDLIRLNDSIVKISLNGNLIKFTKELMSTFSESLNCLPGTYILNNKCVDCEVNTYSDSKNMFECKKCPDNFYNKEKGQTRCFITDDFKNEKTNIVLDDNLTNYLKKKSLIYESAMEKIDEVNTQVSNMEKNIELINKNIA